MTENAPPPSATARRNASFMLWLLCALCVLALVLSALAWRQARALEGRAQQQWAALDAQQRDNAAASRLATQLGKDAAAHAAVLQARLDELATQREYMQALLQKMGQTQDNALLADAQALIDMGREQAQITGDAQALLIALDAAKRRLQAQPQWAQVQRAIASDIGQLQQAGANAHDLAASLGLLELVLRDIDTLPLQGAAPEAAQSAARAASNAQTALPPQTAWWQRAWRDLRQGASELVRVRPLSSAEVALLMPEQAVFVRERMRLRLLGARTALLARQNAMALSDLAQVTALMRRYARPASAQVAAHMQRLTQVQQNLRNARALPDVLQSQRALQAALARTTPTPAERR